MARRLACLLVSLALASAARASDPPMPAAAAGLLDLPAHVLGVPGARVGVAPTGVLLQAEGLRTWALAPGQQAVLSASSSPAWLDGAVDEWAALSYLQGGRLRTGVAAGRLPDWAGRGELAPLRFVADGRAALSIARLGEVQVRTELALHPQVPGVRLLVLVTNRTEGPIEDVTYAREWRQGGQLARAQWSLGDLKRRQSASLVLWYLPPGVTPPDGGYAASALDLPVTLWTSAAHPFGLKVGATNGISWGDFDADGWPDLFACESANLWRNLAGEDWQLAADLDPLLPAATIRYGASFGDWDRDGLPDLVTEPRKVLTGDTCMHLLRNLDGSGAFANVSHEFAPLPCLADGETACWGDVDGDGQLDLLLPAYPSWVLSGVGNLFYRNLGPGASPRFVEASDAAGLDVPPPDSARPEGAQFCDVDGDGDLDYYGNGWLYQNVSLPGAPAFTPLPTATSGIAHATDMDEGVAFVDYDLDGDLDLFVAYADPALGLKLFEHRGDGTFFEAEAGVIDAPFLGAGLGLSAEDWDGDGDLDVSTRHVFRRNELLELGTRKFTLGLTPIPASYTTSATPAWADWDRDGDLDLALGNYLFQGSFWTNTTLDAQSDLGERRDVRVVVVDDGPPGGTQTAFGASVELRLHGEGASPGGGPLRRRKFVASSHGYLNQNEYALTFFLPAEPPAGQAQHVFDLVVDFPGAPGFAPGGAGGVLRRIDRLINPALGDLSLAATAGRELRVFRSGRVEFDGQAFPPQPRVPRDLSVTTGGLQLPDATTAPAPLQSSPTPNRWVGAELDTTAATEPVHLRELLLDGQLDQPQACGTQSFNVALWDVTSPQAPLPGGALLAGTSTRNRRTRVPLDFVLQPGRRYRLVAKVASFRFTAVTPAGGSAPLRVNGSLNLRNDFPCTGSDVVAAGLNAQRAYIAVRWGAEASTTWTDLGGGLAGTTGTPVLVVDGELLLGQEVGVTVRGATPGAPAWFVLGLAADPQPFKGGTLVPVPQVAVGPLLADAQGTLQAQAAMSTDLPTGTTLVLQAWLADAGGPQGAAASNGVAGSAP